MSGEPDPKQDPRVRDGALLRRLHGRWRECAITGATRGLSLHHVRKHPRDDVEPNLVMVEGSGTTGFHGRLEAGDPTARRLMGEYLRDERPDTIDYLVRRCGGAEQAAAWFERTYLVELEIAA